MKKKISRRNRALALCISISMLLSFSGCVSEKKSDDADSIIMTSSSESIDVSSDTMEESTSSEKTNISEVETEVTTSDTSVLETAEPSETTIDPTATPAGIPAESTPTSTPKPTKAPKDPEKAEPTATSAISTTVPTNTPANVSDPTEISEKTDAVETTSPTMFPPPENSESIALSAMKAAVKDCCSGHVINYTDENGQNITIPFQFNDAVMSNVQKRSDYMAANNRLGHYEIDGTWILLEAVAGMGSDLTDEGGTLHWHYFWTDYAGKNHYYDSYYDCIYELTVFLVTEHTTKLSTSDSNVFYGVGFTPRKESTPSYQGIDLFLVNYGVQVEYEYSYVLVVQGGSDFDSAVYGFDYEYTIAN